MFERITTDPTIEKKYHPQVMSRDPWVVVFDNFVSEEEGLILQDYLVSCALMMQCTGLSARTAFDIVVRGSRSFAIILYVSYVSDRQVEKVKYSWRYCRR